MTQEEKVEVIREHYSKPENFWPIYRQFMHIYGIMNNTSLDPDTMREFLRIVGEGIPCDECAEKFPKEIKSLMYGMQMYMRTLWWAKYINELHNRVNNRLDKENLTFDQHVDELYDEIKQKEHQDED